MIGVSTLLVLLALLITIIALYLYFKKQSELLGEQFKIQVRDNKIKQLEGEQLQLQKELQDVEASRHKYKELEIAYKLLEQKYEQAQERLKENQNSSQHLSQILEERFKIITTQILEERSEQLHKRNELTLEPLRDDLKRFGEQVQNAYQNEARERHSLQTEIHKLVEQSNKISTDANNLTQALKGENKLQGNWGEMILEDLLTTSGLERGKHFSIQAQFTDQNTGERLIPDVIVNYPNGGRMIIDSKVNLKAYMEYVGAESQTEREAYAKQHLNAVRTQIKILHNKHYSHNVAGAPDFVIMFIPNEPAYLLAMHQAPSLWQESYDKKVMIMNATNLLATLKLAEELWRREQQQLNIEEIFKKVGDLYDKFCTYIERIEETARHLNKAQISLNETRKTLSTGTGNILRRFEDLKKMGAKTKKQLGTIVEKSSALSLEEEIGEV